VAAATLATFIVVFAVLAIQLRNGNDPALGAGPAAAPVPKRVLVHRIVKRVVVTTIIPPRVRAAAPGASSASSPAVAASAPVGAAPAAAGPSSTAPAPPAPAPAPAAPAPAPAAPAPAAPAPAPAPAAPVTRSS
jgi:hypothetical protein